MITLTKLKTVFFIFILSGLGASFHSCKSGVKMPTEAASLDSLGNLLGAVEQKLMAIDSVLVEQKYKETMADLNFVEQNLKDSITRQQADAISSYRGTRKNLKNFNKNRSNLLAQYKLVEVQLKTLSDDLKKGAIENNKAYEYFVIESTEANKLLLEMDDLYDRISKSLTHNDLYKPQVDSLITRLELKTNSTVKK